MRKFWNFTDEGGVRTLRIEGQIADETWFGDEVTPQQFKNDLISGTGDITLWINSPGGDVFAAAQIYNMLMDYQGDVHVIIDGLAASAASVIAMAGTTVSMSPVAMIRSLRCLAKLRSPLSMPMSLELDFPEPRFLILWIRNLGSMPRKLWSLVLRIRCSLRKRRHLSRMIKIATPLVE